MRNGLCGSSGNFLLSVDLTTKLSDAAISQPHVVLHGPKCSTEI